jgi:PAS domain S-box-containing protein
VGLSHNALDGRWLRVNDKLCEITGYSREELSSGMTSQDITHPDDLEADVEQAGRLWAGEIDTYSMEKRYLRKDASVAWIELTVSVVREPSGKPSYFIAVIEDASGKWAEEEHARLAAIVESSEDAIIAKTLEGIITSWNPGAKEIYGYSAEEAVGQPISMLAPPERSNEIPAILERLRRGEKVEHFETVRVTKDGERRDISLSVSPIKDSAGNIVEASTIARDITEQKRIEAALREIREAERRRMAHDLHDGVLQDLSYTSAALGLVMLNSEVTSMEEELQRAVDAVRRAAQGLRDVVNDLRLEEEVDRPFPQLVDSLVERSCSMDPDCDISLEVEEGFPFEPLGDVGVELSRVVREGLTNARRHSGASSVRVTLRTEEGYLVAEAADDGQGFAAGSASEVGLRSMRERTLRLGGDLEVESDPGEGTRVRIRAPMMNAALGRPTRRTRRR